MSDDSDSPSKARGKRDYSSTETTSTRRKCYIRESDSDSDSSVEIISKKKHVDMVTSDTEGGSSVSEVIRRKKGLTTLVTDSGPNSNESESEYESDWATEPEPEGECKSNDNTKTEAPPEGNGASSDASDGQSEKCLICLSALKNQEVGSPESCDHCFCVECIVEWSKTVNTCPVDRQTFNLILVHINYNGKVVRQMPIEPPQQQNEVDEDPTSCDVCGRYDRQDRILLCAGCNLGFHLECLDPPLNDIPASSWLCAECRFVLSSDNSHLDPYEINLLLGGALGWLRRGNAR